MPPKKKNNAQKNAFFFYMQAIKPELIREGYDVGNMQVLVALAGPRWQKLDEDLKESYKEKAKIARQQSRCNPIAPHKESRRDCSGQFISERIDTAKVISEKTQQQRARIKQSFAAGRDALDQSFHFIDFMVTLTMPNGECIPCEVGVVEFSVRRGIIKTLHRYIKPGQLPLGFRYQAISSSENTHKIPVEGMADPSQTYASLWNEIRQFVAGQSRSSPPFYSKSTLCEQTEFCLSWLLDKAGNIRDRFQVFELEGLMFELDMHLDSKRMPFDEMKTTLTKRISTSAFDYDHGTRCEYHEEKETKHCAIGTVKRYCYCMAEDFCDKYDISLTENHLPSAGNDDAYVHIAPLQDRHQPQSSSQPSYVQQMERDYRLKTAEAASMSVSRTTVSTRAGRGASTNTETGNSIPPRGRGRGQVIADMRRPGPRAPMNRPSELPGDELEPSVVTGMDAMSLSDIAKQQQQQQLLKAYEQERQSFQMQQPQSQQQQQLWQSQQQQQQQFYDNQQRMHHMQQQQHQQQHSYPMHAPFPQNGQRNDAQWPMRQVQQTEIQQHTQMRQQLDQRHQYISEQQNMLNNQEESDWPSLSTAANQPSRKQNQSVSGAKPPSIGRGSRMSAALAGNSSWAGSKPAPHPSLAPDPPSTWTGHR